jgi:tRNA threonylcarbamoyladenosine biosynthesis protein TsaE
MEKVALGDISTFAKEVLGRIEGSAPQDRAYLLALHGDLGAGKTTFTQALGKALEIQDTMQSPTYVLMKAYAVPPPPAGGWLERLVHIDAYRLDAPEELAALKPETFLHDPHTLVVVEWPERVGDALPKPDLTINFSSESASASERYVELI